MCLSGYIQTAGFNPEANVQHPFSDDVMTATLIPPDFHSIMVSFLHREMFWQSDVTFFADSAGKRSLVWKTLGHEVFPTPKIFSHVEKLHLEFRSGSRAQGYPFFISSTEDRRFMGYLLLAGFRILYSYHKV